MIKFKSVIIRIASCFLVIKPFSITIYKNCLVTELRVHLCVNNFVVNNDNLVVIDHEVDVSLLKTMSVQVKISK